MSKADDELFGLKSSKTGECLHSKSADEMFEKLGYDIDSTYEGEGHLYYCKNNTKIDFDLGRKDLYKYNLNGYRSVITMPELKAIYLKCKELGWLDE